MTYALATKPRVLLTSHQREVLEAIIKGNAVDDPTLQLIDLDELLERVTRVTTKQSMQFTIRALVHNGVIVKAGQVRRRGRLRVTYEATQKGKDIAGAATPSSGFVESPDETAVDDYLSGL